MSIEKITTQVLVRKPIGDNPRSQGNKVGIENKVAIVNKVVTGNKVVIEYDYEKNKTIVECMQLTSSRQGIADSIVKFELVSGNPISVEDTGDGIVIQCTGRVNDITKKEGTLYITRNPPVADKTE